MARIEFNEEEDHMYCDTSDVARWFEQYDDFGSTTNPTAEDVKDHIFEWMVYIDRQTGHAWRPNTVHEEYKDPDGSYNWWSGRPYHLGKRHVRDFDSAEGDKVEEFDGSGWDDWLQDPGKEFGRENDYWLDNGAGIMYLDRLYWFRRHPNFRVTYRYGNPDGPTRAITMACAKLVASDLASTDQYSMNIPGTDGSMSVEQAVENWREDAERTIAERKEVEYVGPY